MQIFLESRCHLGYDFEWCKKSELLLSIYIWISIYVRMYVWMYVWRWIRSGSFRSCLRMWMCARNVKWRMPSSPCCSCPADPSTDKVDLTYSPSMYVCTHLCMYVCMYVWVLQYRLQIHEERLGRKRKHSEFCGIITMYVYIRIYYMHLMYVCMHGMANCVYVVVLQETEQLLVYPHGKITCSVPLRGSIPLKGSSPVHMKYEPIQTLAQIFTAYICLATFFKVSRIHIGFTHVHTYIQVRPSRHNRFG